MNFHVKTGNTFREATREEILDRAWDFLTDDVRGEVITPDNAGKIFRKAIGGYDREHVAVAFIDVSGRVLSMDVMFRGTLDESPVYQREVARRALMLNAAGVLIAHNHPSSKKAIPSNGDKTSTVRLAEVLELVDVRLIAAFVVTPTDSAQIRPPSTKDMLSMLLNGPHSS